MVNSKMKRLIRVSAFLLLLGFLFFHVNRVLERKTVEGAWNYSVKIGGYKNEPKNTIDVLVFGSSHAYCTVNPLALWDSMGLTSYVLATQQQPLNGTYYYVQEALKTQTPKVLLIEAFMAKVEEDYPSEAVAYDAIDPLPWSVNKAKLINDLVPAGQRKNYYVNFLKYHTRWQSLTPGDFDFSYKKETDPFHGYVYLTGQKASSASRISYDAVEEKALSPQNREALQNIVDLAKEKGIAVVLLIAPYSAAREEAAALKAVHAFAKQADVPLLDLNERYEELGLNNDRDYYDAGHLNVTGAEKVTAYIGEYLKERFVLRTEYEPDVIKEWDQDIAYYKSLRN